MLSDHLGSDAQCNHTVSDMDVTISSPLAGVTVWGCSIGTGTVSATLYRVSSDPLESDIEIDSASHTISVTAAPVPTPGPLPLPPAPQNLSAGSAKCTSIHLTWDSVEDTNNYRIRYGASQEIETTNTSRTVTNLTPNTDYTFTVDAHGDGETYRADWGADATEDDTTDCPRPGAPASFRVVSATCTTIGLAWNAVSGANNYRIEYGGPTDPETTGTRITVSGLTGGTNYLFSIRAFGDGDTLQSVWGAEVSLTGHTTCPAVTIAPNAASITEGEDSRFTLTASPTPTSALTVRVRVTDAPSGAYLTETIPTAVTIAANSATAQLILATDDDQMNEADGTIRAQVRTGTGYIVGTTSAAVMTVEDNDNVLETPTDLTITPLPQRKARLDWTGDPNAINDSDLTDDYIVQVRRPGMTDWQAPNLREQSGTSAIILLDTIWEKYSDDTPPVLEDSGGMADLMSGQAFEYRIRALYDRGTMDDSDPYRDSAWSDTIRIVDNPILTGGSANGYSTGTSGQVAVTWEAVTGATGYTLRWRKMPNEYTQEFGGTSIATQAPHSSTLWRPQPAASESDWQHLTFDHQTLEWTVGQLTKAELGNTGDIYAFQLNYISPEGKGFSVREAYAWPSGIFPEEDKRVATFPYFGHWPGQRYVYRICEMTFPADKRAAWVSLIPLAFGQWDIATDDLVTTIYDITRCSTASDTPNQLLKPYKVNLNTNEVYMVDTDAITFPARFSFTNHIEDLQGYCVFGASACVISHAYGQGARAATELSITTNSRNAVDVLFNKARVDDFAVHIPDISDGEVVTQFNSCVRNTKPAPAGDFGAYRIALHEAGHALGASGFSYLSIFSAGGLYERSHPTIADSVMNYDDEVAQIADEPDCSPHPFDILAMYALYQKVD